MTRLPRILALRGALLLLAISLIPTAVAARSPGKRTFERAYEKEKTEPEHAIRLYRRAIAIGLERKLRSAARWRMFFLYRRLGQFPMAFRLVQRLGSEKRMKPVVAKLEREVETRFGISAGSAAAYARGVRALYGLRGAPKGEPPEVFLAPFREAVSVGGGSRALRTSIVNALVEKGYGQYATSFATPGQFSAVDQVLFRAERLMSADRHEDAGQTLYHLARTGDLSYQQRGRLLYLLGRIERKRRRHHAATAYFRQAARYAGASEGARDVALAAYVLYRRRYPLQALALLRGQSTSSDPNVRLLQLILRVEVDGDKGALARLRAMRPQLSGALPRGTSSYLARKALGVLKGSAP